MKDEWLRDRVVVLMEVLGFRHDDEGNLKYTGYGDMARLSDVERKVRGIDGSCVRQLSNDAAHDALSEQILALDGKVEALAAHLGLRFEAEAIDNGCNRLEVGDDAGELSVARPRRSVYRLLPRMHAPDEAVAVALREFGITSVTAVAAKVALRIVDLIMGRPSPATGDTK